MHLRGTGEGFAANIGGRLIGTSFAAVTQFLAVQEYFPLPGETPPMKMAYAAAFVGTGVYLVGMIASFWLPEPTDDLESGTGVRSPHATAGERYFALKTTTLVPFRRVFRERRSAAAGAIHRFLATRQNLAS